jgi:dTDP-4-amino-4,6-dideoxygalactose transaminase
MIRLTVPSIDEVDLQSVREVLSSGFLVQGARVASFEREIAKYVGSRLAVAVTNGTASLHLALLALGTGPGDIVLTSAYSFVATANAVELCGARPVFVDIRADTFNLDARHLKETIEEVVASRHTAGKVKAILPVHSFGQIADMPEILQIAERHGLPVVEDGACALGAKLFDRAAGSWGTLGCFSFHPRKAITTGEGGVITLNDKQLAHKLRMLRNHGQNPDEEEPDFLVPGFNYRMTEFQAALGQTQLLRISSMIAARRRAAAKYASLLSNLEVQPPITSNGSEPVFQSYVVLLPENLASKRSVLIKQLRDRGVETTIGTYHIPLTTYYRKRYNYQAGDFPVTDDISKRALALPLYAGLSERQQEEVVQQLRECIGLLV